LFVLAKKKMAKTNHLGSLTAAAGVLVAEGLLVLMLMVVEVRPAGAAFPGQNGKIAYSGFDGHDSEIYTIDARGGGRVKVTNNNKPDLNPTYSPSGKKIAFEGDDGHDSEIYTINAPGGGRFQLTHSGTLDTEPMWGTRP
jgi:hypothetical protein